MANTPDLTIESGPSLKGKRTACKRQTNNYKSSPGVSPPLPFFRSTVVSTKNSLQIEEPVGMSPSSRSRGDTTPIHNSYINVFVDGQTFQSSKSALMLASPIWDIMLRDTPENNDKYGTPPTINLDGHAKAVATFLSIVHYRFAEVPVTLGLSELYELSLTMAQYKCTHLTFPWARGWLSHLNLTSVDSIPKEDAYKSLWIAYTFGEEALYKSMLRSIILNISCDADGHLAIASGAKLVNMMLPAGLLDIITETRAVLLDTMFNGVSQAIGAEDAPKICRVGKNEEQCESMVMGSLMRELRRHKLFPNIPNAGDYAESVQTLVDTLKAIKSLAFVGPNPVPSESHANCGLGLRDIVLKTLEELPLVLTDEHEQHLRQQGLESGVAMMTAAPGTETKAQRAQEAQQVKQATQIIAIKVPVSDQPPASTSETPAANLGSTATPPLLAGPGPAADTMAGAETTNGFPPW